MFSIMHSLWLKIWTIQLHNQIYTHGLSHTNAFEICVELYQKEGTNANLPATS